MPAGGHTDVFNKILVASMTFFFGNMYEFKNAPTFPPPTHGLPTQRLRVTAVPACECGDNTSDRPRPLPSTFVTIVCAVEIAVT